MNSAAPLSLSDDIYHGILRNIIAGELEQGSRLRERTLSEQFGVSRVPIREAIHRLEREGFVESAPRRGAIVRLLSYRDVQELYQVRLCIEPHAAYLAATRAASNTADLSALRRITTQAAHAIESERPDQAAPFNIDFHEELVRLSGNRLLEEMFRPLLGRMEWIFNLTNQTHDVEQLGEHRALLEAIAAGQADLARSLAFVHLELHRVPVTEALAAP
ncbi:GntR family transcriptional regulator [Crystallibacter degradans]|uniref:GntR family transcriptional regulator n=1 Tax=Crystallibacter degradans TaxID=2726743 RepID=UPI001473AC78|nr:GntR family transcriptional regulator [Arthrobacter sp. SF27]NMR29100.1 GntR family transcriptional regulator [Arthrobacter sp. SF27]